MAQKPTAALPDYISLNSPDHLSPAPTMNSQTSNPNEYPQQFTTASWELLLQDAMTNSGTGLKLNEVKAPISDHPMTDAPPESKPTATKDPRLAARESSAGAQNTGDHLAFIANDTQRKTSNGASNGDYNMSDVNATAGAERAEPPKLESIPQFMLFGRSEDELDNVISKKSLLQMPDMVLRRLAAKGEISGPSITMKNYSQAPSMIRMKGYLDNRKYIPFKPRTPLQYMTPGGAVITWERVAFKPEEALRAVQVTQETEKLLEAEIDLYFFAKDLNYDDLRKASMDNIIYQYPKSVRGIWTLVELVFTKAHSADDRLRRHIIDLIEANRKELTSLPPYVQTMLRYVTTKTQLGQTLLDAFVRGAQDAHKQVAELKTREQALKSQAKNTANEKESARPQEPLMRSSPPTTPRNFTEEHWPRNVLHFSELPKLASAINEQYLLVALR
ncbi:hypothetical protein BT63DRAFT_236166 [Microthyrium microscopicum]|uniref:Uncharacterized protein n=1 Tax=Microthyrium microscopicum TaxID=703497 RepID=A0A6A6UDL0_9PEZI|nr:hypothetical protein BT63DRAFT_236166 [Microthyrium microscopicum]